MPVVRFFRTTAVQETPLGVASHNIGMAPGVDRHAAKHPWVVLWSPCLFVRLTNPDARREAITSRPWLMTSVGRQTEHAGQTTLTLTGLLAADGYVVALDEFQYFHRKQLSDFFIGNVFLEFGVIRARCI